MEEKIQDVVGKIGDLLGYKTLFPNTRENIAQILREFAKSF